MLFIYCFIYLTFFVGLNWSLLCYFVMHYVMPFLVLQSSGREREREREREKERASYFALIFVLMSYDC